MLGVHALGRVVAGRFWCSYARVSLTQTAPVRPRGWVCAGVRLCARVCVRVRSYRWVVAVWCGVAVWCHTSFLLLSRRWCAVVVAYLFFRYLYRYLFLSLAYLFVSLIVSLSASLTPLISISMTIKNGI